MKPNTRDAMFQLIGQIREALPFDSPAARVCEGPCDGCSMKLLEYMDQELENWEHRLKASRTISAIWPSWPNPPARFTRC